MRLEQIDLQGFKGITLRLRPTANNLCLFGRVGSGKTSVIEAVRLALLQPTRFKDSELPSLAPTGRWRVAVTIDGVEYARSMNDKGTGAYEIDRASVLFNVYARRVGEVVKLEGYQIDLGEFLGLSGQKRAELFARMVPMSTFTFPEAIRAATGMDLAQFVTAVGGVDCTAPAIDAPPGLPAAMVEVVRVAQNEAATRHRAAGAMLEKLQKERPAGGTRNRAELQNALGAAQQELGAQRQRTEGLERANEQRAAAQKALGMVEENGAKAMAALRAAETLERDVLPGTVRSLERAKEDMGAHQKALEETRQLVESQERRQQTAQLAGQIAGARKRVADDLANVVLTREQVKHAADGIIVPALCDEATEPLLFNNTVRAVLSAVGEQWRTGSDEELRHAQGTYESARAEIARLRTMLTELDGRVGRTQREMATAEREIERLREKVAKIPELRLSVQALEDQRLEAVRNVQGTAAADDADVLLAQNKETQTRVEALQKELTELDRVSAIAGQIDRARADLVENEGQKRALASLTERVQQWRDRLARAGLEGLMGKISANVDLLLGPDASASIRGGDTGRSTVFEIVIHRGGFDVPMEQLSGGETVLAAAAFITAMQDEGAVPFKLLTVDAEGLDGEGVMQALIAMPKLKRDMLLLATNAITTGAPAEWGWHSFKCQPGSTKRERGPKAVLA